MDIDNLLNEETTICPECAETIKLKAKKCRFCGAQLDPEEVAKKIKAFRAELAKGKVKCPRCGSWDVYKTYLQDGGLGDYCPNCKQAIKTMKAYIKGKPTETKVVVEQKSGGVWKVVGVLLVILLILVILGMLGI
jgi:hypothetical protein